MIYEVMLKQLRFTADDMDDLHVKMAGYEIDTDDILCIEEIEEEREER
jgi:hypothetical protein